MADRVIDAIRIKIGADTSSLRADLQKVAQDINKATANLRGRQVTLDIRVNPDKINTQLSEARTKIHRNLQEFVNKEVVIRPTFTVTRASADQLRKNLAKTLTEMGPAQYARIPIKAKLDPQEAARIRNEIQKGIGTVTVLLRWEWENGPPPTASDISRGGGGSGGGDKGGGGGSGTRTRGGGGGGKPAGGGAAKGREQDIVYTIPTGGNLSKAPKPPEASTARPARTAASGRAPKEGTLESGATMAVGLAAAKEAETALEPQHLPVRQGRVTVFPEGTAVGAGPGALFGKATYAGLEGYKKTQQYQDAETRRVLREYIAKNPKAGLAIERALGGPQFRPAETPTRDAFSGRARSLASLIGAIPNENVISRIGNIIAYQRANTGAPEIPKRVQNIMGRLGQGNYAEDIGAGFAYSEGLLDLIQKNIPKTGVTPTQASSLGTIQGLVGKQLTALRRQNPKLFAKLSDRGTTLKNLDISRIDPAYLLKVAGYQSVSARIERMLNPAAGNQNAAAKGQAGIRGSMAGRGAARVPELPGPAETVSIAPTEQSRLAEQIAAEQAAAEGVRPRAVRGKAKAGAIDPRIANLRAAGIAEDLIPQLIKMMPKLALGGMVGMLPGYAGGGSIHKTPLLDRMAKLHGQPDPPFIPEWLRRGRAGLNRGKDLTHWKGQQPYVVGEQGSEIFVPESAGWIIPHRLMDQLPKRALGGRAGDSQRDIDAAGGISYGEPPKVKRAKRKAKEVAESVAGIETQVEGTPKAEPLFTSEDFDAIAKIPIAFEKFGKYVHSLARQHQGSGRNIKTTGAIKGLVSDIRLLGSLGPILSDPAAARAGALKVGSDAELKRLAGYFGKEARTTIEGFLSKGGGGGGGGAGGGGGGGGDGEDGAGAGGGPPKKGPKPELTPLQKFNIRREARQRIRTGAGTEGDVGLADISGEIAERQQLTPVRALSVAFGQLTSNILGGRSGVLRRTRIAQEALREATAAGRDFERLQNQLQDAEEKRLKAQTDGNEAEEERLHNLIEGPGGLKETAKTSEQIFETQKGLALQSAKKIAGPRQVVSSLAAGAFGITAGTIAFSALLGAAQEGFQLLAEAGGKAIERMSGFRNESAGVTKALAEQTNAAGGATKTIIAQSEALTGLSASVAATVNPILQQRTATEAGNKAFETQLQTLHTYQSLVGQGQIGGFDRGLVETTGGLNLLGLQTPIGGTPSMVEQIANELFGLGGNVNTGQNAIATTFSQKPIQLQANSLPFGLGDFANALFAGGNITPQSILGLPGVSQIAQLVGGPAVQQLTGPAEVPTDKLAFFDVLTKDLNDSAKRAGSSFAIVAADSKDLQDAQKQEVALLHQSSIPGLRDLGAALATSGTVLKGVDFKDLDSLTKSVLRGLQAVNQGANMPDFNLAIQQLTERVIPARLGALAAQQQLQANTVNPANFALANLARPNINLQPGRFGAGTIPQNQGGPFGAGFQQQAQSSADTWRNKVGSAIDFVNKEIEVGRQKLLDLGVPEGLLKSISAVGQQIAKIEVGITQEQTNLTFAQLNNELRITTRSLGDARDILSAIKGNVKDTYGGLQGENIVLSRQLQLLQFAVQQRQITTQVALAGFQAPGQSPQERAVRRREAQIEAEIAQKQLNLNKQIGANQYQITGIEAGRNVTDLTAQVNLLKQGIKVQIDTTNAQKALEVLGQKQDILVQKAQTYLEKGVAIQNQAIQTAETVAEQTGAAFKDVLSATSKAWGVFTQQASSAITSIVNSAPTYAPGAGYQNPTDTLGGTASGQHAAGYLGMINQRTTMVVGEAGNEMVAIIRNPQTVTGAGGGGGGQVNITFNINATVRHEGDIRQIVAQVEQAINKKILLLGLRGPAR